VSSYILDHLALTAGLAGTGSEHQRRETSRLLHAAVDGGPSLVVPALCLAEAAGTRPAIAEQLAALITDAPAGTVEVAGLVRTPQWDAVRLTFRDLSWPAVHAAAHAITTGTPIMTTDLTAYTGVPVDILLL
jgi:hypothetical protein